MMRRFSVFTALFLILSGWTIRAQAIGYCSGNWCQVDQAGFDPVTGTYLGYDGAEPEAKPKTDELGPEIEEFSRGNEEDQAPPASPGRWVYHQGLGWTFVPAQ